MRTLNLDGRWRVRPETLACTGEQGLKRIRKARGGWLTAAVPGEVHLDLIRAGKMEEPLVSTRAHECRWPEGKSWWYRRTFDVAQAFLQEERQELVLDGIDLYGQVFLNGTLLGETHNAFVAARFDVTGRLRRKRNELVVRVTCGSELSPEPQDERLGRTPRDAWEGKHAWPGRKWLRKPQFTYGWDWVDALPNIGLWRGVRLEGHSWARLAELQLQTHMHGGEVFLGVDATVDNLHPWSNRACRLVISVTAPEGRRRVLREAVALNAQVGRQPVRCTLAIPEPQLWWPNGMGEQPLYTVTVELRRGKTLCDRRELRHGLRTVSIDQAPLAEGSRFCLQVNGEDVFCRGGNWIPADAILARVKGRKYAELIESARTANLNMLRIWGGGIYENDVFYDLCDEAGILVWQDFMFACSPYPDYDEAFCAAVRHEAEAAVRRLRHHACIALWSGNNENIWGMAQWWKDKDYRTQGTHIYNDILPDVCARLDPSRPYWPSSPCGGDSPNDEQAGDCHWWGPATMNPDVERRIRHEVYDECRSRFNSEYGIIGPCHLKSIAEYLTPDEMHVDSKAFKVHTNWFEKETTPAAIRLHYAEPEDLDLPGYVLYGQMFQAMMYGLSIEAMRFRKHDPKDDCAGALIWMYDDCWGETGWTPIDYYLRRKASYYWIKRACASVKPIVRQRGRRLVTRVVNDSRREHRGVLLLGWVRLDGTESRLDTRSLAVPANGMVEIGATPIPGRRTLDTREWLYLALLRLDDGTQTQSVVLLHPQRELALEKPHWSARTQGPQLEIESPVYCHGVHLEDGGRGAWSDNFVELVPGIPCRLERTDGRALKRAPRLRATQAHPHRQGDR